MELCKQIRINTPLAGEIVPLYEPHKPSLIFWRERLKEVQKDIIENLRTTLQNAIKKVLDVLLIAVWTK